MDVNAKRMWDAVFCATMANLAEAAQFPEAMDWCADQAVLAADAALEAYNERWKV
jgi:hypothetical protein